MAPQQNPQPEREPSADQDDHGSPEAGSSPETGAEDRWLRAAADLDNFRKRRVRELQQARADEREQVAASWLPMLDNLDAALQRAEEGPETITEGVRMVRDQAVRLLAELGYPRYEDAGVPFDPARHEVVHIVADSDAAPGTVLKTLRPGYGEVGQQLRPALVAVAAKLR